VFRAPTITEGALNGRYLPEWLTAGLIRPDVRVMEREQSDDQLWQVLDEPGIWIVRGGSMGVLGRPTKSLHTALQQAHEFSMQGQSPGPIVRMPDDDIVVPAEQIWRLWRRLGFSVG
jgi:hypothetical protein